MSSLSQDLQNYLSRSSNNSPPAASNTPTTTSKSFGWFGKGGGGENVDDSGNGWFTEAQKDPLLPNLSKKQRVLGFVACLLLGTFCFSLASLYLPFLVLKARKFALLYTLGSLCIISSFSLLWGPTNHIKHLCSGERLPFSAAYFGTMFATLYFSMWLKSTPLTVLCAVAQIIALLWYIISYVPGGQTGLKFFSKIFYVAASKTASKTLPV